MPNVSDGANGPITMIEEVPYYEDRTQSYCNDREHTLAFMMIEHMVIAMIEEIS